MRQRAFVAAQLKDFCVSAQECKLHQTAHVKVDQDFNTWRNSEERRDSSTQESPASANTRRMFRGLFRRRHVPGKICSPKLSIKHNSCCKSVG